jgi:hypothetical protein
MSKRSEITAPLAARCFTFHSGSVTASAILPRLKVEDVIRVKGAAPVWPEASASGPACASGQQTGESGDPLRDEVGEHAGEDSGRRWCAL